MPAVVGLGAIEILLLLLMLGFQLPLAGVMLLGAVKMRQLKAYGLAQLGGIAALVPCGPMWMIGLPVGIWVLWTLNQPDVKRAFDRAAGAIT